MGVGRLGDAVAVLAAVAVVIGAGLLAKSDREAAANSALLQERTVSGGERYALTGTPLGDSRGDIRLVVFTDFQCPFCRDLHSALATLRGRYPGRIAVLYRHYPIAGHGYALAAAMASECAAEQGRFVEYATMLFASQDSLSQDNVASQQLRRAATRAGVPDSAAFARCLESEGGRQRIEADIAAGLEIGIVGTPTLLVGERLIVGALPLDSLVRFIGLSP